MASMVEIAEMLLSLIDAPDAAIDAGMGVDDIEYIGQGVHKIYVERDTLLRIAGRMEY